MTTHPSRRLGLALPAAAALLLGALFGTSPADAQRELYVGFHLGRSGVEVETSSALRQVLDGDENSLAYEVGYRLSNLLGFELGYHDLSKVEGLAASCTQDASCSDVPIEGAISAVSVSFVPRYRILGRVSVFAKLGLVAWDAEVDDVRDDLDLVIQDLDEEDVIYGAGVEVQILGALRAVGRWESIGGEIETFSVGVRLSF